MLGLFAAGLTALAVHARPADVPPRLVAFSIPASLAEHGLRHFVRQAGVEVVFEVEQVKGRQTNAVDGFFTTRGALEALVAGTGLVILEDEKTGALAVKTGQPATAPDKPLPQSTPTATDMNTKKNLSAWLVALFLGTGASHLPAQTDTGQPSPAAPEEIITLSVFEVSGKKSGRYQSTEATSGRVRINVFDSPQNISIINREIIEDVAAIRVVEAAKYVAGVTLSSNTSTSDRTTIRGFQVEHNIVDGFQVVAFSEGNLDTVVVDRLEVVKGPSPILAKSGSPGGAINIVTRKPEFRDFGSLLVEGGVYESDRAQLDVNRVFGAKQDFAVRLLGAYLDTEGYHHNYYNQTTLMPMVAWRTSTGAQLTLQGQYTRWGSQNFQGLPIDPSSGTNTPARILDGVKRDLNTYGDDRRWETRHEFRAFLTVPLTDAFSYRLAARFSDIDNGHTQNTAAPQGGTGGARDPRTGIYEPGLVFGPAPTFTPSPAAPQSRIFNRGSGSPVFKIGLFDVQGDANHVFKHANRISATTTAGFSITGSKISEKDFGSTSPPLDYDNPTGSTFNPTATLRTNTTSSTTTQQIYAAESLEFWQGRIALSGNVSYNNFDITLRDRRVGAANPSVIANVAATLTNWGAVVKPIPGVALYYSKYENATPATAFDISTGLDPLKEGETTEYGIRYNGLNGRVFLTVGHFNTDQLGFSFFNPGNRAVPPPNPPLPSLVSDRKAKGWEYEVRVNLTEQFSLIGNYADFTNRNTFGQRLRNAAERSWAILAHYKFKKDSRLGGFNVSVSADWLDDRAGDDPAGLTTSVTPVPNQPTFFLSSRTLVNLTVGYQATSHWSAQLNIENLFDKEYLASSSSRNLVWTGDPINARLTLRYKF